MLIPQTWLEHIASYIDLDVKTLQEQKFPVAVSVAATTSGNASDIPIPEAFFCFGYRSYGWLTASGNAPAYPYNIGFKVANGNDWTNGQWAAPIITGDCVRGGATPVSPVAAEYWPWPRELARNERVTCTIDNPYNAAMLVHVALVGVVIRERTEPVRRGR